MSDNSKKEDMTRIEDLSEFLHSEDSDLDDLFSDEPPPFENEESSQSDQNDFDELSLNSEDELDDELDSDDENNITNGDDNFSNYFSSAQLSEDDQAFPDIPVENDQDDFTLDSETTFTSPATEDLDESSDFNDTTDFTAGFEVNSDEETNTFESSVNNDEVDQFDNEYPEQSLEDQSSFSNEASIVDPNEFLSHEVESNRDEDPIPSSPRENFREVVEFGNNISYGKVQSGGNPAFSVMLKGIENDDFDSILGILNEHGLVGQNENIIRQSLDLGVLLIAQISEFSAIYLAGKLKKYATDINIGLSEQIHKSKSYDKENKGLVTKRSIYQNKDKKFTKERNNFSIEDMVVTINGQIPNTQIKNHIGVVATSRITALSDLTRQDVEYNDEIQNAKLAIHSNVIYDDLIKELSVIAYEKGANAVLSITYSMSALSQKDENDEVQYQIICSGDAVIIDKL